MHYIDTRGRAPKATFKEVLLAGTAPGGGLYLPETYPLIDMELVSNWDYPKLASYILYPYVEDAISFEELDAITHKVYTAQNFGTEEIVPIEWLMRNLGLLHLSNGPTLAFKDLAMMLVARLMDFVLERLDRRIVVVVATSGDTGGAAVEAFRGLRRVELVVLFPEGRVSLVQQRIMTTSGASNVHTLAVRGTFDDCQAIVKVLFSDEAFYLQYGLAGVNSINWARVIAQTVYWVSCGVQVLRSGAKSFAASVPSGNFGDAFSLDVGRHIGVPVRNIIVATNQNDVLHRAMTTGIYRPAGQVVPSMSPSMDIQVSSNFERLIFEATGREGDLVADMMDELKTSGEVDLRVISPALAVGWSSCRVSEEEVLDAIRWVYQCCARIIDPHTAVAMYAALQQMPDDCPIIVAETARPEKFPDAIKQALGIEPEMPAAWAQLKTLPERVHEVGTDAQEVKQYIIDNVR